MIKRLKIFFRWLGPGLITGASDDDGMQLLPPFLDKAGVNADSMALSDGRDGGAVGLLTPQHITTMLRYMSTRDDFELYKSSLPIMGVDGSFAVGGIKESPANGNVWAKSDTTVLANEMHNRAYLMTKALAGYIKAKSGRDLVYLLIPSFTIQSREFGWQNVGKNQPSIGKVYFFSIRGNS